MGKSARGKAARHASLTNQRTTLIQYSLLSLFLFYAVSFSFSISVIAAPANSHLEFHTTSSSDLSRFNEAGEHVDTSSRSHAFIFDHQSPVQVNPDVVVARKELHFNSVTLHSSKMRVLDNLLNATCSPLYNRTKYVLSEPVSASLAQTACDKQGLTSVRLTSKEAVDEIRTFMRDHDLVDVAAPAIFQDAAIYDSHTGQELSIEYLLGLQLLIHSSKQKWQVRHYLDRLRDPRPQTMSLHYDHHTLNLRLWASNSQRDHHRSPHKGKYNNRVICQVRPDLDPIYEDLKQDCASIKGKIRATERDANASYAALLNAVALPPVYKPPMPLPGMTSVSHSPIQRLKRFVNALLAGMYATYSAVTIISQLATMAKTRTSSPSAVKTEPLTLRQPKNMDMISDTLLDHHARMHAVTNVTATRAAIQKISAIHDLVSSELRDNSLAFSQELSFTLNGKATRSLITHADLDNITQRLGLTGSTTIDRDLRHYEVRPARFNNTIVIEVTIPIITSTGQAYLVEALPFPIFVNGVRYTSICNPSHLVVYSTDMAFSPVTVTEASECRLNPGRCTIRSPRSPLSEASCVAADFYELQNNTALDFARDPDQSPFILSAGKLVFYSLPHQMDLHLECPEDHTIGIDNRMTLSGRGAFANEARCSFALGDYRYISSSDPTNDVHLTHSSSFADTSDHEVFTFTDASPYGAPAPSTMRLARPEAPASDYAHMAVEGSEVLLFSAISLLLFLKQRRLAAAVAQAARHLPLTETARNNLDALHDLGEIPNDRDPFIPPTGTAPSLPTGQAANTDAARHQHGGPMP